MTSGRAQDFLSQKRVAVVGVSRDPKDFTRGVFRELQRRGYAVVPVNPQAVEVEGERCFARLQDVVPVVDAALLMTPPAVTEAVVRDCAEAGITRVWMHQGAGRGAVSPEAVSFCHERGMSLVAGACPYMFLPGTGFGHRLHGFALRLLGRHPG